MVDRLQPHFINAQFSWDQFLRGETAKQLQRLVHLSGDRLFLDQIAVNKYGQLSNAISVLFKRARASALNQSRAPKERTNCLTDSITLYTE